MMMEKLSHLFSWYNSTLYVCLVLYAFSTPSIAQTMLIRDIHPGSAHSNAEGYFDWDGSGVAYFVADDGTHGRELWRTDGTTAGTYMVADINSGAGSAFSIDYPIQMVRLSNALYFVADDGNTGMELWRTDGTAAGTMLVKDINPGPSGSFPFDLVVFGGMLFFSADDGMYGSELWRSDGTSAGTTMVLDLYEGPGSSFPSDLTVVGNKLIFSAYTEATGTELWWTINGVDIDLLEDINPGPLSSFPTGLSLSNGLLYFTAYLPMYGYEPFVSDGTPGTALLLSDINPGAGFSFASNFTQVGMYTIFKADDGLHGEELWITDGTELGTNLLKDICPGACPSFPVELTALPNGLIFSADDGSTGTEPWFSDGTPTGTQQIGDIWPGTNSSDPYGFTWWNEKVYFAANDGNLGSELWVYDPPTGTWMNVEDINPGNGASNPYPIRVAGPNLYLTAEDGTTGREPRKLAPCNDQAPPQAVCQNITVYLDHTGMATITPEDIDAGSTDDCGIANMSVTPNSFDCSYACEVEIVTLKVTDVAGKMDSCVAFVWIVDSIAPQAVCVDVLTVYLDQTGHGMIDPTDADAGSTDNCGVSLSVPSHTFDCSHIGDLIPVQLTVSDPCNNKDSCIFHVAVKDTLPPNAMCKDITVQLDASGSAAITAADIDDGSSDNCGIASMNIAPNSFNCNDVGSPQTVTLTVTDLHGNTSTCTASVTAEDLLPPQAICMNLIVSLDASGSAAITAADIDNGSSDNCGIASMSVTPYSFDCDDVGSPQTVTLTVTDIHGNVGTCTASVTIEDNIPPTASCQDVTLQLHPQLLVAFLDPADVDGGSSDNCEIDSMSVSPDVFDCNHVGTNQVTLKVIDRGGNSSECMAKVTVVDPPINAVCMPGPVGVNLNPNGMAQIAPALIDGGSTFGCTGMAQVIPNQFNCADIGLKNVTLRITTPDGQLSQCITQVQITDPIPPTALCKNNIMLHLNAAGMAQLQPADVDNGSFDNCGIANMQVFPNQFNCADIGQQQVQLQVTDNSGNQAVCMAQVLVVDPVPPTALCIPNLQVALDMQGQVYIQPNQIDANSTDNCQVVQKMVAPDQFTCAHIGTNQQVTLTVVDASGNASQCMAIVQVVDPHAPTAQCVSSLSVFLDQTGLANLSVPMVDAGSSDNCPYTSMIDTQQFDCSDLGTHIVTLHIIDNGGQSDTCQAQVVVQDTIGPRYSCDSVIIKRQLSDDTVYLSLAQLSNDTMPATDNCNIDSTDIQPPYVVWDDDNPDKYDSVRVKVWDAAGNTFSCLSWVKLELPTAIGAPKLEGYFKLMPNPTASEQVTLSWQMPHNKSLRLALFDLEGRVVWRSNWLDAPSRGALAIHLDGYSPGVYLLKITDGAAQRILRLVLVE